MRNILDTLKREHDDMRALFTVLGSTPDDATEERTRLLEELEATLVPHAKWEELVFYPAFAARATHDQLAMHGTAMQEHRAVEQSVLPDLHAAGIGSRQFLGSARALFHMIDHHAAEEESQIFGAMRQLYNASELAEFDEQYEQWKDSTVSTAVLVHAKAKTAAKSLFRSPRAPG